MDIVYLIKFREPGKNPWTETIVKWNPTTGEVREFTDLPINFVEGCTQNALSHFSFWKGELFAFPLQGDSILKINTQTDEITRFGLTPEFDFFERKSDFYNVWAKDLALPYVVFNVKTMKYLAQLPYDYSLADIDFDGEVSNRRKWYVEGIDDLYKDLHKATKNIWEEIVAEKGDSYLLIDFLENLCEVKPAQIAKEQKAYRQNANSNGTSGRAIHDYVKVQAGI
jgi:hypothetical protein